MQHETHKLNGAAPRPILTIAVTTPRREWGWLRWRFRLAFWLVKLAGHVLRMKVGVSFETERRP